MAAAATTARTERLADLPAAEAAARLYEAYRSRVLRYCTTCLRSREDAEDATQSTFLYALRALERGVEPQAEAPWLFAIARNVCLARHRSCGRRAARETLQDPVVLQDVSEAPERAEGLVGVEEALTALPESQRRAILLREWQGLSYREIAVDLGLSVAAVETLIFRARRSLAQKLDAERAQEKRRALRGFDLGSAAAGLKALLGGGAAAKVAVTAATVAAVVTVVGQAGRGDEPNAVTRPAEQLVLTPPAERPIRAAADLREHVSLERRADAAPVPTRPALHGKKDQRRPVRAAQHPLPPAESDKNEPDDPVPGAIGSVEETVDDVVPALPHVTVPEVPELPVDLPTAPEPLPELPLP